MPINFTDFSQARLLDSPWKNALENVLTGYKISKEPAKMREEQSKLELANALQQKALKNYDEKFALERDLKKAQIDKAKRAGMAAGLSPSGDVKNAEFIYQLKQSGADPKHIEILEKAFNAGMKHTEAITNRSLDITAGGGFDKLPTNEKKRAVGLMTAMGVDPVEGTRLLRSGVSPSQYAKENNIKIDEVTPVYPLGEENIKQLQRRNGFVKEIKNLENNIAGSMGEYQNKIMGYSLNQVADALTGENPDKQGKVLAARALQPELAALRLKVAGGNIGIEAINELKSKSLGDLKILESLIDPPTYLAMQKYMTKWLEQATNEFQRTQEDYGRLKTREQKSAEAESGMGEDPLGLF